MKTFDNFELKNISWIKIGGKTPKFIEAENHDEFVQTAQKFIKNGASFEVIGLGANTLISDNGINNSVIKAKYSNIEVLDKKFEKIKTIIEDNSNLRHKFFKDTNITSGYDHSDINYSEHDAEDILVKIDTGTGLPYAITFLISNGITGLQMFSGIPGTIGGSVFNNIHGGPKLLSEFIYEVEVIDKSGNLLVLNRDELKFGYNQTRFQETNEVITSVTFSLKLGDKERAKHTANEWAKRKSNQPRSSLGSTFHNLEPEEQKRLGFPNPGAAYLIEHQLKLSGYRVGGIMIPEQTSPDQVQVNKNIFMNTGNGTAKDYLTIMKKVYNEAYLKFGIKLKPEIFLKGFEPEEIKDFIS